MPREALPAATLYAMLDQEFKKARNPNCTQCMMPLPFYRQPADEYTANWHVGMPRRCSHGCLLVIVETLARLWTRYDLQVERRARIRPAVSPP